MIIEELNIGNLVYMDSIAMYTVKIVAIDDLDYVTVDFPGNEGDPIDIRTKDILPINIDKNFLEKNNEYINNLFNNSKYDIKLFPYENNYKLIIKNNEKIILECVIKYIHELQNELISKLHKQIIFNI